MLCRADCGLLYEDGAFKETLAPGKHNLKSGLFDKVERRVVLVDMRERSLIIKGQEILTSDKVAIRVSILVQFRVSDPKSAVHTVDSFEDRLYSDVQLAARRSRLGDPGSQTRLKLRPQNAAAGARVPQSG